MKKDIKRSGKIRKNRSSKKNSSTKSVKRKNLRKSGGSRKSLRKIKKQIVKRKTHSKGGANPLVLLPNNFPITKIDNSDYLFDIKPGEVYQFFGFKLIKGPHGFRK